MTPDLTSTPVTTQADLEQLWRSLMGELGFSRTSLWFLMLDAERRPLPQVAKVDDLPVRPDDGVAQLAITLRGVLDEEEPGGTWVFLRSRRGTARVTDDDRAWARALTEACRAAGVPTDVVHLAANDDLVPLPLDTVGVG